MHQCVHTVFLLCVLCLSIGCARELSDSGNSIDGDGSSKMDVPDAAFRNVAEEWGIGFSDMPSRAESFHLPAIIGSGCAVLDFNRDGGLDLLWMAEDSIAGSVALYRQDAIGRFVECSNELGLRDLMGSGVAVGDMNNDGWPDLYVASSGKGSLWRNVNGTGFQDVTASCGIENPFWGTSASWLDYDRDGWLDLFITNYVEHEPRKCHRIGGGDQDFCSPGLFPPTIDKLFRNISFESADGRPAFADVTVSAGIAEEKTAGLGVICFDWNEDGWIDIYVANDQRPNVLWINDRGKFRNQATLFGCDTDFQGRSQGSMGLTLGDLNGDGKEELVVSNLDGEPHAVYSRGSGSFSRDVCRELGIASTTRPITGFGITAADFDGDGVNDILTVNGRVMRSGTENNGQGFWSPYQQKIQFLKSDSTARKWREMKVQGARPVVARGLATGDLDRDGDVDAVISVLGGSCVVLRNDFDAGRHRRITATFVDPQLGGRPCPGTSYRIRHGETIVLQGTFQPCQSYMSSHAEEVYLTIPGDLLTAELEVIWPHGTSNPELFPLLFEKQSHFILRKGLGQGVPTAKE
jgi:hypothetical protein